MSQAWTFQDSKQIQKHGPEKASWFVGWIDPEGKRRCKSCGPGADGRRNAEKLRRKVEAELTTGTYRAHSKVTWESFVREYDERILAGLAARTRPQVLTSLAHFARLVRPGRVSGLTTAGIDQFIAARRREPGDKKGSLLSPATVNHDLRHLKSALRVAVE
jgi:hypothetical protein